MSMKKLTVIQGCPNPCRFDVGESRCPEGPERVWFRELNERLEQRVLDKHVADELFEIAL